MEVHNNQLAFIRFILCRLTRTRQGKNGVLNGTATLKQFLVGTGGSLQNQFMAGIWSWRPDQQHHGVGGYQCDYPGGGVNMSSSKSNTWVDPLL